MDCECPERQRDVHERPRRRRDPLLGGSKDGTAPAASPRPNKGPLPHGSRRSTQRTGTPAADRLDQRLRHRRGAGQRAAAEAAPLRLYGNTCGGPGFLYTTSTSLTEQCQVALHGRSSTPVQQQRHGRDHGPDRIGTGVDPAHDRQLRHDGQRLEQVTRSPGRSTSTRTRSHRATQPCSQDYTQVGPHWLQRRLAPVEQATSGRQPGNCSGGNVVQRRRSRARPSPASAATCSSSSTCRRSAWLDAAHRTTVEPVDDVVPGSRPDGRLSRSRSRHTAIDQEHIVLMRDSVQNSGNRTRAI